ncbi:protein kinase domain-containing protein [Candidatus Poriferisocius sp.]|uniref:protein kinase domain-containing protein n=1 Tax=Candidatus Poriferisocius sp. TaxID=3101276 RepID=UPI003B021588
MKEIGRVLGKRYRLVSFIGSGRFTNVFLAHDLSQSCWVAVKLLPAEVLPAGWATDPNLADRFVEAARETASVAHPNIVATRDWGKSDYGFHVVTDYLEGGSLLGILESGHLLSPSQTLMVGLEVARGLEHIHRLGLIHQNIRPSNILFDNQGQAHLADLGLSRVMLETAGMLAERSVFTRVDAVRYAPPEQTQGLTPDHKSDVYSLVLVLTEVLSGQVPFDSDDPEYTQMAKMGRQLDLGGQFGRLGRVLEEAGQPDRNERPSAGELATGLLEAAESLHRPEPLPLSRALPDMPEPGLPGSDAEAFTASSIVQDTTGTPTAVMLPQDGSPHRIEPAPATPDDPVSATRPQDGSPHRIEPAGFRRLLLLMVLLVGAVGFGGYMTWDNWFSTETRPVPDLAGTGEAGLLRIENEFGWVLDRREQRRDGTEAGQVLSQNPQPGTGLKRGETVTVWVSLGPELVAIPAGLVGIAVQDAETVLAGVGLSLGGVVERHDEIVLEGVIIQVDELFPEVEPGGQVDLVVSLGPVPRVVPAIDTGTPRAVAVEKLEDLRLRVEEWRVEDNQVASGLVVRVEPPPGTEVAADSVVTVVVSDGPQQVTVPPLATLNVEEATEILEGLGLCPGEIEGPNDTEILASNPPAAAVVDFGTCIKLITRPE